MSRIASQSLRAWLLCSLVFLLFGSAARVWGQGDDPLAGQGDQPKVGSTAGGDKGEPKVENKAGDDKQNVEATKEPEKGGEQGGFEPAVKGLSAMGAMAYVYILVAAIVCWLVGWLILYLIVRQESPGNAGLFGCFVGFGLFFAFLSLFFFGWIVPAFLPEWLVWTVVAIVALGLIVTSLRLSGGRRIVALLVGLLLLGGLVYLWMFKRQPPAVEAATTPAQDTAESKSPSGP